MKIQQNYYYIPKELITNEAIYSAVVYALKQAGGKVSAAYGQYKDIGKYKGLFISRLSNILWTDDIIPNKQPITLQQLFNHEDFRWPEGMDSIGYSVKGKVVFYGERGYSYIDCPVDYEHPEFVWMPLNLRPKDITLIATKENKGENTMSNEFTKSMLIAGKHVVEYRDGELRLVLETNKGLGLSGLNEYRSDLDDYSDNLLNGFDEDSDIVKVYTLSSSDTLRGLLHCNNLELVWKRNEKSQQEIEYEKLMEQIAELQKQAEKLKP